MTAGAPDADARVAAVQAATAARDHGRVAEFSDDFASEPSPRVRAALVRAVATLDPVKGGILAKAAMADSQPFVRMAGAEALAQTQGAASVPDLAAAFATERNAGVRHSIAFWLGAFSTPAARSALAQALADADPNVRLQAARSLQRHGNSAARSALKAAKNDSDPRVRGVANEP